MKTTTDDGAGLAPMDCSAFVVRENALPASRGVLPSEVGQPGPWFGVRWPCGHVYGWWHGKHGVGGERIALQYAQQLYGRKPNHKGYPRGRKRL